MFISKKKYIALEKRIADLEVQVQSQQKILQIHIHNHKKENDELRVIFDDLKRTIADELSQ